MARNRAIKQSVPAPVGGWNTRDALDAMPSTDAVILDNWWPTTGKVTVRKGYASHATGMGSGNVDTVTEFRAGSVHKLIACANGNIYDATSAGAASSIGSGFTVNNWQTVNFNARIFFVNGTDAPQDWDGTTLTATAWSGTGLTIANLIGVNVFKSRLFFWEDGSQDFWYAGVNAVTGTLTKFPLSRVGSFGGNLVAMGTWTLDGGDGVDDYAVFLMSSGEVIVYQGDDPGVAADWALVGVYRIGVPLDIRGLVKVGRDLIVMTKDDYVSLSDVLSTSQVGEPSKLSGAIRDASDQIGTFGWQAVLHRSENMILFNYPTSAGAYEQHVVNTATGAASRFKDIPSRSWGVYDGELYFGSTNGVVYKYTGNADNGSDIAVDGATAWTDFDSPERKLLNAMRPSLEVQGSLEYEIRLGFDFNQSTVPNAATIEVDTSEWDTSYWDLDLWSDEVLVNNEWRSSYGEGVTMSVRLKASSQQAISWIRTDYLVQMGLLL